MKIIGYCSNPTHCEHSGEEINLSTFEWKACWNCHWFLWKKGYLTVREASKKYDVSESTIRRWCNSGKLNAHLCKKGRYGFQPGSNKLWIIFNK